MDERREEISGIVLVRSRQTAGNQEGGKREGRTTEVGIWLSGRRLGEGCGCDVEVVGAAC
jgi:hypothetical protein